MTTKLGTANINKVVLVTGASSGIGQFIATQLAQDGYRVYGTSRTAKQRDANSGQVTMLALDVTSDDSAADCISELIEREGRIDVLINNAGVGLCGAIEDTTLAEARWQMETNFFGPLRMIHAVLPHMRAIGQGRIITVGSLAGLAALPFQAIYSASKFALEGINEALRIELAGSGIDATIIAPGDFKTGFTAARVFTTSALGGVHRAQLQKTLSIYERDEMGGADPLLVARLVSKLVVANRLNVRYTVGRFDQRVGILLKGLLPASLFERLMKQTYSIPLG